MDDSVAVNLEGKGLVEPCLPAAAATFPFLVNHPLCLPPAFCLFLAQNEVPYAA